MWMGDGGPDKIYINPGHISSLKKDHTQLRIEVKLINGEVYYGETYRSEGEFQKGWKVVIKAMEKGRT